MAIEAPGGDWGLPPYVMYREEVRAVKRALRQAGVPFVRVRHGTETAAAWLVVAGAPPGVQPWALRLIRSVTGRQDSGKIIILGAKQDRKSAAARDAAA
jgi:hypothetical protein